MNRKERIYRPVVLSACMNDRRNYKALLITSAGRRCV